MEARRGSILISVLALAALLGVLAMIASEVVHAAFGSSRTFAENIRAEVAARAVLEQLVAQGAGQKSLTGSANVILNGSQVQAQAIARDESARVDLNAAPLELIAGVFRIAGVDKDTADGFAARVVDWRDKDDRPKPGGAESDAYRAAGRSDGTGNRPFAHVAELSRVLGISPGVAAAAAPYFTVASKLDKLNPLFADPILLLALPDVTISKAQDFVRARETVSLPFDKLITRLGQVSKFVTEDNGSASRVDIVVRIGNSVRLFEAVVAAGKDEEPYRLVSWQTNPTIARRDLPQ